MWKDKFYNLNWITFPFLIAISLFFLFAPLDKLLYLTGFTAGDVLAIDGDVADHFTIVTPEKASAGEPFTVKIIAKDEFDNVITDYDKVGRDIEIATTGTGTISPTLVAASEFKDGIATVDFVYDKTETFTIIAREVDLKEKLKNHYKAGRSYFRKGDYVRAIGEFEKVLDIDAGHKGAVRYLMLSHQAMVKETLEAEVRVKREAQERARKEAEERARKEAEERARREAEERARREAEERARREAEERARREAEEKRRREEVARVEVREYTIGEEDVLDISVWGWEELAVHEAIVRPDGKISFPLVGDVQAVGLTLNELDKDLTEKLKVYIRSPEVSVMLRKFGGKKVIVLGEVKSPGVYRATGKNTIMEVIALAGGFTEDAVLSSVILVRGDLVQPEARRVNLTKVIKEGDMAENISVQPEDVVYVPRKFIANINYFLRQFTPILTAADIYERLEDFGAD